MNVLLIEDNEADRRAIQEAFKVVCKDVGLHWAEDGEKILQVVQRKGAYTGLPPVDLILLDLNLPGASGHDVLRELKENADTRKIPVIVFTSSTFKDDIRKSYALGANCYINKPMRYAELLDLVKKICQFWFGEVRYSD